MSSEVIRAVESGRGAFHLNIFAHGNLIEADEPVNAGGLGLGFTPTELLCAALAACTTMTLREYCTRKQWNLKSVRTEVIQEPRTAQSPQAHFERTIYIDGALSDEQTAKLLAIANRCPVHLILETASKIDTELKPASGAGATSRSQ